MTKQEIINAIEVLNRTLDTFIRAKNDEAAKQVTTKILELTNML